MIVHLPKGGSLVSLTPLWRAANWSEREFIELYGISVEG
ncbi:NADH-quinone oxidoreductase subunit C [Breoghania sp.]|nr:NADH-quinone oxidoreductase subunit C [Breoghania sp.]MDJ0931679.1 NADH-quinone oxidoreductase subunit C [Breoghania sp.]